MKNRHKLADREVTVASDGQETHLALALSPLKRTDGEFSGLIVVLDDLTQLIKAQKIAAWKEVAQRVAHEIKNPLTPIQLSAERIIKNLQRVRDPATGTIIEEGARTIIQEAGTIKSLVDEFSNFARMPKVQLRAAEHPPDRRPDRGPLPGHLHRHRIRGRVRPRRARAASRPTRSR